MSVRVVITRSAPDAAATAERVRAYGAEPVLAPLLTIAPRAFDTDVTSAQALAFTSSNGVAAFASATLARNINVFTVGDATAHAARQAGFAAVRSADGDVAGLARLLKHVLDRHAGPVVHIGGAHLAGDLGNELTNAGFAYDRRIAYEAEAVTQLPAALSEPLDVILFHSPRAAETFLALGAPNAASMVAGCLSQKIADAAAGTTWKRVIVAPAPREDALLAATLGEQNSPAGASA